MAATQTAVSGLHSSVLMDIEATALRTAWLEYQEAEQRKKEARRLLIKTLGKNAVLSLYFIQNESGLIKIGLSENPEARLKALQQGTVDTLTLLKAVPPSPTRLTEHQVHKRFKHLRVRDDREWFRPAPELLEFIGGIQ